MAQKEKKKKREKKNKTEQQGGSPAQTINDGQPILSQRDLETSESRFVEGLKFFMLEDYQRAIDLFQKSNTINPRNAAVHFKIAEAYMALGDPKAAQPYAAKALEIDSKNRYYYLLLAQVHAVQKEYEEATKVFNRLFKEVPGSEEYLLQLADLYVAQNKLDEAVKAYDRLEKAIGPMEEVIFKKAADLPAAEQPRGSHLRMHQQ